MFKDLFTLFPARPLSFSTPITNSYVSFENDFVGLGSEKFDLLDKELDTYFNSIDKWFDSTLKQLKATIQLPFNLYKTEVEGQYVYEIAMAGYDPEKISIYHENDQLKISYNDEKTPEEKVVKKVKEETSAPEKTYLFHGIREHKFNMRFNLPSDAEIISQKVKNGILSITVQVEKKKAKKTEKLKVSVE